MKKIVSILSLLLLCSTMAFAEEDNRVIIDEGITNGTVTYSIEDQTVTLTVTPAEGYYLESISAIKTVDASAASRTRTDLPVLGEYELTKTSESTDRSSVSTYTLTLGKGIGAYVTATFAACTPITADMVTLSATEFTYTGKAILPAVTVKVDGKTLVENTDFWVDYSNNNAAKATDGEEAPVVYVGGKDIYGGKVTINFTINKAELTITTGSDTKQYNGTALTNSTASVSGLVNGETATVSATGSQTDVGTSKNTYSIEWGTAEASNYTITEDLGTLEVTAATLTITAASDSKVYDGKALTKNSYTNTDLATGDAIESVTITGSQTAVGKSDNVPSAAVIKNAAGDEVTANYAITYANGTLEVSAATVTITAASDSKVYDGTALTKNSYTNTALATGDAIESVTITGSQTIVGKSNNVPSAAVIKNADGDDVTGNYAITYANGTLEVTAATMTGVTVTNYSGTYDGKAHTIKLDVPKDATVKYGTAEGTYNLDAAPTYKEVGTYTVYFKVTKANYKDYQGSGTVEIKSSGTVIIDGVPYASLTDAAKAILGDLFPEELLIGLVGSTTPEQLNDILSRISVDEIKGIVASQGPALQLILRNLSAGDVLKILADGNLSGAIAKLKLFAGLKVRAKSRTRSAADDTELQIVSGQEYLVLEDCDLIITLHTEDAPVIIQSIIIRTPGDANGDGLVNAADLVEMVKAMNGQASDKFILKNADMDGDGEITEADIDAVRKLIMGE